MIIGSYIHSHFELEPGPYLVSIMPCLVVHKSIVPIKKSLHTMQFSWAAPEGRGSCNDAW